MIHVLRGVEKAAVGATPEERIQSVLTEIASNPDVQAVLARVQPLIDALTPAQQFRIGLQCGRDLGLTTLDEVRANPLPFIQCVEQQLVRRPKRKKGGGAIVAFAALAVVGASLAFGMSKR